MRVRFYNIYWKGLLLVLAWLLALALSCLFFRGAGVWLQTKVAFLWRFLDAITQTAGIRAVITSIGAVCFALTYVNTAREKRIKGILIDQVIGKFYPNYGWVFAAHFLCAVLGQYACAVEARTTAVLCLAGMLLSLAYAVEMALSVVFSRERAERLVSQYIEVSSANTPENRVQQPQLIHQVGQYVGRKFLENALSDNSAGLDGTSADASSNATLQPERSDSKEARLHAKKSGVAGDTIIGQLLGLCGMTFCGKDLPDGSLLAQFDSLFGKNDENTSLKAAYILYALPCYKESWQTFQNNVLIFSQMWQSLLAEMKDTHQQAELAYRVLCEAALKKLTAPTCCGLILYLHETSTSCTSGVLSEENRILCTRFLGHLGRIHKMRLRNRTAYAEGTPPFWCLDILAVFLCLVFLEQANFDGSLLSEEFCDIMKSELSQYSGTALGIFWDELSAGKYLCYGYAIYRALAIHAIPLPSRREMARIVPSIAKTLRSWLP